MSNQTKAKPRPARANRPTPAVAPPKPAVAPPKPPGASPKPAANPPVATARPVAAPPRPVVAPPRTDDAKRTARQGRQEQARAAAARRRQMRLLRNIGIVAAVVLVVGGIIGYSVWKDANLPGQAVPMQASPHIPSKDAPHAAYTTDPPTSGPHVPSVPAWGVSTEPIPKELQVHGLEDAGVIINYRPDLDSDTVAKLATIVRGYPTEVILAPYPGLSDPIVATAWTRIERFSQVNEPELRRFIEAFRGIDHHGQSGS